MSAPVMDAPWTAPAAQWHGVFPGVVAAVDDPDGQGRVRVRLPWAPDAAGGAYETWARLITPMAGASRGVWMVPDPGDEVAVAFEAGDPDRAYVLGGLWNGRARPPATMDARNTKKVIRSRNGVTVTLDDADGREALVLETPGGQSVRLGDGPGTVEIHDSSGNSIRLDASGITVTASAKVTVQAASVDVSAGAVKVDAGMSTFSGVVKADTVITNTVISSAYTPGAGNIW